MVIISILSYSTRTEYVEKVSYQLKINHKNLGVQRGGQKVTESSDFSQNHFFSLG